MVAVAVIVFVVIVIIIIISFMQGIHTHIPKTIHHHHKHQGLDPLIRSVRRVTVALSNVSSVFLLSFFLVVCSGMISRGFGFVAFFASVKTSLHTLLQMGIHCCSYYYYYYCYYYY